MKKFEKIFNRLIIVMLIALFVCSYLWLINYYAKTKSIIVEMQDQTFGIPEGWHLTVNEDTGLTYIESDYNSNGGEYENN